MSDQTTSNTGQSSSPAPPTAANPSPAPSDPATSPPDSGPRPAPAVRIWGTLDPVPCFAALGNSIRWELFKLMAHGREFTALSASDWLRKDYDGVNKHLHVLRDSGLVTAREGQDRRETIYFIRKINLVEPGVVDYGFCRLELSRV